MSAIPIQFNEGPPANPLDSSGIVAIIGYCSTQAPTSSPTPPNVIVIDSPTTINPAAGYGPGPELANLVSRRGKKRCLLVPTSASVPGVLSSVTQTGNGPIVTVAAVDGNGPRDDASVTALVKSSGAPGVATVAMSWSYSMSNGVASLLYQSPITIPARTSAQVLGTVDLTTLVYATPAVVTGTVDLTTLTYGPGGTVDGETLSLNKDGGGAIVTTFAAPSSPAGLVGQINTAMGAIVASLNQQNKLVLTGATLGSGGSMVTGSGGGGTAYTALGITATHTTNGIAGTLDGLTLIFTADTGGSQTVTFASPDVGAPATVVSGGSSSINAKSGIVADVYTAKNVLRIRSSTLGSTSSLQVTGGTALAALGLTVMVSAAVGAESTYTIPHLGVTFTFSPNTNGNFQAGTTYAYTCKAPKPSDADIIARIADLRNSGQPFGPIVIASETDVTSSLSRAVMLDAQMVALHALDLMKRVLFGLDPAETDANIYNTFTSFRSAWVDRAARGCYLVTSANVIGGGWMLRSSSWLAALADAFIPYYKDRGDRGITYDAGIIGLPDCGGITSDEDLATQPLVGAVGGSGTSCNVLTKDPDGGYYFSGGYSSADGTSKYCDASVRNVMLFMAQITATVLARFQNDTDLATQPDKTLDDPSAETVNSAVESSVNAQMVPTALQACQCQVDQTIDFYDQKKLAAVVTGYNRVPARSVSGTVGPGIVSLTG